MFPSHDPLRKILYWINKTYGKIDEILDFNDIVLGNINFTEDLIIYDAMGNPFNVYKNDNIGMLPPGHQAAMIYWLSENGLDNLEFRFEAIAHDLMLNFIVETIAALPGMINRRLSATQHSQGTMMDTSTPTTLYGDNRPDEWQYLFDKYWQEYYEYQRSL